jgi:transposase
VNLTLLYPKYTELRKANPEFARRTVISLYENTRNISKVAKILKATRKTVRKIIRRFKEHREEGLKDLSRRPKRSPNKTPPHLELAILSVRKNTGYGRDRIARVLKEKGIEVKPSTVRYVLERYGLQGRYKRSKYRKRRRFYDFDALYPLSHFEVDLKEIYDKGTLRCTNIPSSS